MRKLTIHTLPGESPFQAVSRVIHELEKAFNVEIGVELEGSPSGMVHITAEVYADIVVVDQITEETWKLIRTSIQRVADRALRGDRT